MVLWLIKLAISLASLSTVAQRIHGQLSQPVHDFLDDIDLDSLTLLQADDSGIGVNSNPPYVGDYTSPFGAVTKALRQNTGTSDVNLPMMLLDDDVINQMLNDLKGDKPDSDKRNDREKVPDKRSFDSIQHISEFGGLGKRGFDSIEHLSEFGGFGKRSFDPIDGMSAFGGLGKRSFDSIGHSSVFGGFGKRSFDSISHLSDFGGFGKRGFDKIGHISSFGGFGKRSGHKGRRQHSTVRKLIFDILNNNTDEDWRHPNIVKDSSVITESHKPKRSFDRIGYLSSFGGFGRKRR